jgi:NACHT domain
MQLLERPGRRRGAVKRMSWVRDVLDWIGGISTAIALTPLLVGFLGFSWVTAGSGGLLLIAGLVGVKVLLPRHRFGRLEKRRLRAYHRAEVERMAARLPIEGAPHQATHEGWLRAGYGFVEPRYSSPEAGHSDRSIVDVLTDDLRSGRSMVLLGEPGAGKSLLVGMVFARLADAFKAESGQAPCPILLNLNALRSGPSAEGAGLTRAEEQSAWLREQLISDVLLPGDRRLARLLARGRVVLLCDGLDEAPTMRSPQLLANLIPQSLFGLLRIPSLLTCRTAFHSIYVDATELMDRFPRVLELLPLRFEEQGVQFLRWYAEARGHPQLTPELIKIIGGNPYLKETVARPLVLRMAAEVLSDLVLENHEVMGFLTIGHGGETSAIYSRYVDKWLQREQAKEPARLTWWQKRELIEWIAWEIFNKSLASGRGWGHFELNDLLIENLELRTVVQRWLESNMLADSDINEVCREIAHRSFLIISTDRRRYRFVHKSFFEFCVARHIVGSLDERRADRRVDHAVFLLRPLPDEVIDFIRELLLTLSTMPEQRNAIEATFLAILAGMNIDEGPAQLMAAQQAANLVPIVASTATMGRLRVGDLRQEHPFLQRAIAVADALHHDRHQLLDEFVGRMESEYEAESFHMGYNRIYYGDQAFGNGQWLDDGHPECGRFFRATVRHLRTASYRRIRVMDLYSLRVMLRDPDRRQYLLNREGEELRGLQALVDLQDPKLGPRHNRQRLLLRAELSALMPERMP